MDREGKPPSQVLDPERDSDTEQLGGFGVNAALVEEIRQRYEVDPSSVHASWADHFEKGAEQRPPAPATATEPPPAAPDEISPPPTEIARSWRTDTPGCCG
jgi:2-oxoglutarate dehydrogenase complex dehydrogenase (E1) component-like enzyme